jgi:hypothetical protein
MLFQILIDKDDPNRSKTVPSPFTGRCRVKLIKIEYLHNTGGAPNFLICRLNSDTLFNSTPGLSGRIFFNNTTQPYYANNFVFEATLPDSITVNITLANGNVIPISNGNFGRLIITLDIEPINKMIV